LFFVSIGGIVSESSQGGVVSGISAINSKVISSKEIKRTATAGRRRVPAGKSVRAPRKKKTEVVYESEEEEDEEESDEGHASTKLKFKEDMISKI
jgi:hypothetical protein